jgi:hypothetical protein
VTVAEADREDWPFDQGHNVAAISDRRVFDLGKPVLFVVHYSDDHSWAFLAGADFISENAMVVGMGTIVGRDPTLRQIADLPSGWTATRDRVGGDWNRREDPDV